VPAPAPAAPASAADSPPRRPATAGTACLKSIRFAGEGGSLDSAGLVGFSMNAYLGVARGFSPYADIQQAYAGRSNSVAGGAGLPFDLVSTGGTIFYAAPGSVVGVTAFIGVGASFNPSPVSGGFASSVYTMDQASFRQYHDDNQSPTLSCNTLAKIEPDQRVR